MKGCGSRWGHRVNCWRRCLIGPILLAMTVLGIVPLRQTIRFQSRRVTRMSPLVRAVSVLGCHVWRSSVASQRHVPTQTASVGRPRLIKCSTWPSFLSFVVSNGRSTRPVCVPGLVWGRMPTFCRKKTRNCSASVPANDVALSGIANFFGFEVVGNSAQYSPSLGTTCCSCASACVHSCLSCFQSCRIHPICDFTCWLKTL